MEHFESVQSVRLRSHLGTYLCAVDDDGGGEAVSHGYRRNSRGTAWAVEVTGHDYVRLQGHRGLYLCATDLPAAVLAGGRGTGACCRVIQGAPSNPNDAAYLWSPRREGEHGRLTLSGPYGRLLRARFGDTPRDNAVTVELDAAPEESYWVVEVVPAEAAARPPQPALRLPCRALSCDARLEATATATAAANTASSASFRLCTSAKELRRKLEEPPAGEELPSTAAPAPRTIFYNTAREDGGVDDFDEGTWKHFAFNEQSLAALRHRLQEETRREDFIICGRSSAAPRPLFPVALDLPPGNADMEFVLVLVPSQAANGLQWPYERAPAST